MALAEFHERVREKVRIACEDALMSDGFVPDPLEDDISEPGMCMHVCVCVCVCKPQIHPPASLNNVSLHVSLQCILSDLWLFTNKTQMSKAALKRWPLKEWTPGLRRMKITESLLFPSWTIRKCKHILCRR